MIFMQIPYPSETNEEMAVDARTVVGPSSPINHPSDRSEDMQESHGRLCSACNTSIVALRYQCANCPSSPTSYSLCPPCEERSYILHDPMHVFIKLPRPVHPIESPLPLLPKLYRAPVGPPLGSINTTDPKEYLKDVTHSCALCDCCMTHIQGEWFRCVYCGKDFCGNCEASDTHDDSHVFLVLKSVVDVHLFRNFVDVENPIGTPPLISNLDSCHNTSYNIMIKSLETNEVQKAVDASHPLDHPRDVKESHGILCSACNTSIMGLRYQCANCPSSPTSYSLCLSCEERSYLLHDPMHVFIKLPRPVQHPIESPLPLLPKLYRAPVGPPLGSINTTDPKEYLKDVIHPSALCDRCMTRIQGEWFRCAYCGRDLCGNCEVLDTHDDSHVFLVFKSVVDMELFRDFVDMENPNGSPPVISHPVYQWEGGRR